jgi:hypothetical protein
MDYLKYGLDEIFTIDDFKNGTDDVFERLVSKEIQKAMVLKDSRSKFVVLNLKDYENLIKGVDINDTKSDTVHTQKSSDEDNTKDTNETKIIEEDISPTNEETPSKDSEIDDDELKKALEAIDKIGKSVEVEDKPKTEEIDKDDTSEDEKKIKVNITKAKDRDKKAKEVFWD